MQILYVSKVSRSLARRVSSPIFTAAVDASGQTFPEAIEDFLEDGIAVTSAFNRRGTMLAVGCNDGRWAVALLMPALKVFESPVNINAHNHTSHILNMA